MQRKNVTQYWIPESDDEKNKVIQGFTNLYQATPEPTSQIAKAIKASDNHP